MSKHIAILKSWSGSIKVIESDTIRYVGYGLLLVFYTNFVPNMHHFWDIRLQKAMTLKKRVRGPSRSLKMPPFDRAHMTCYWRSIPTMGLSRTVFERQWLKSKIAKFSHPLYFVLPLKDSPWNWVQTPGIKSLECWATGPRKKMTISSAVSGYNTPT